MMDTATKADAAFRKALALHQQGLLAEARGFYQQALRMEPRHFHSLHLLGVIAAQTNQPQQAVELIGRALAIDPNSAAAYNNYGNALRGLGHREAATQAFDRAVAIKPDFADGYFNRALLRSESRQFEAAIEDYERAIALQPGHATAGLARANAMRELGRHEEALQSIEGVIAAAAEFPEAHNLRGIMLAETARHEAALQSFDTALALKPDFAEAHNNRGNVLRELKRHEAALASLEAAVALQPNYADAHYNRGLTFSELKLHTKAIASYDEVIALDSGHIGAHNNRALALRELKQYEAAIAGLVEALERNPNYAEAHHGRGLALFDLEQYEAAVASHQQAIALNPDYPEAHFSCANAQLELKQHAAAIASYDRALALKPDLRFLNGLRLHAKLQAGEWSEVQTASARLAEEIAREGSAVSPPFHFLALSDSAGLQRRVAEVWVREECPENGALGLIGRRARQEKIRVGYFSADFRNHAVSTLTAELFELQDRSRFEVMGFSLGPESQDQMRKRLEGAFDRFIDVRRRSDPEVALLARSLGVDIAVDLGGFTLGSRPGIFALRAAPLQVSYLGYSGTMGAGYIDYLIADRTVIPPGSEHHYREQIIYLPHSYLVNDSTRVVAQREFRREELGLPPAGFVFCCFNNSYKISPSTFEGWMRILRRVEGSVLWLSQTNATAAGNLRKEAAQRGVSAERLIFAPHLPSLPEHLARHRAADLFLDTLPYNAHTTASDALWAGLPVLTLMGESFAARVAGSLLRAIGLPELISLTQARYEELAIELATQPERLAALKRRLAAQRLTAPLYDTRLFTKHLEAAYTTLYERYHADLPPATVEVATGMRQP
jgi:protein O-GlcNAc transferase